MKRSIFCSIVTGALLITLLSAKDKDKSAFDLKEFEKTLAQIPAGQLVVPSGTYDSLRGKGAGSYILKEKMKSENIPSFFISEYEVSNYQYLVYLDDLQKQGKENEYYKALPDTLVWQEKLSYNEPYTQYYFRHPAYRDYPLVGVSHEQAEMYCKWLTEKYNSEPKRKFKNVVFKLPTRYQWEYAARGGLKGKPFPWGGPNLHNSKGESLANFYILNEGDLIMDREKGTIKYAGNGDEIGIAGMLNDNADITAPVHSYFPNGYGVYNMAGNAEEYVREAGITRGGSWADSGYFLRVNVEEKYNPGDRATSSRGFRFVMEVQ